MNKMPNKVPIDLGDKRLNKRYEKIEEAAFKQPTQSLSALFQGWYQTKAIYRFYSNKKVTYEKLIDHQYQQTISHIKNVDKQEDILVLQDTTHLNYEGHKKKEELFPTHPHVKRGINVHPSVAVTSSRINLGVLHATTWTGQKEKKQLSIKEQQSRPIEEKKSYRWLQSFDKTRKAAEECPEKTFFNISDREGDIYDLFLEASKKKAKNVYFIIRSSANRKTTTQEGKLKETIDNAKEIGKISFECKRGDKKRIVAQTVKVKKVEFAAPTRRPHLDKVEVWVVQAEEKEPPKGEEPIKWTILTNYPVESLEDAKKILQYYTIRWEIEIFFKVLKSGCQVEKIGLETLDRLKPCLAFYMSIASRIMFLLKIGRAYPNLPCDILFSFSEWKVVYIATHRKKPPEKPPPLSVIIIGIAILGGYLNRKNDPPPGPKVMWIGIQKMHTMDTFLEAYENSS